MQAYKQFHNLAELRAMDRTFGVNRRVHVPRQVEFTDEDRAWFRMPLQG